MNENTSLESDQELKGKHEQQRFEEWKIYSEHYQKAYDAFDKTLITVAAGAFILSISLIHEFSGIPCLPWFLYSGWLCFALALLGMLVVMRLGLKAHSEQAIISWKYFENPRINIERDTNKYVPVIEVLYYVVMSLIVLGIASFTVFAIINYPMKDIKPSTSTTQTTQLSGTKSAPLSVTVPKSTTSSGGSSSSATSNTSTGSTDQGQPKK